MPTSQPAWLLLQCAGSAMALAAAGLACLPAQATSRLDPLDPKAPVPPLPYSSPLKRVAATAPDKPVTWRQANDTVAQIGGWRTYLREAQAPEPAASAAASRPTAAPALPAPPAVPAGASKPGGHHGHKTP